MKKIILIWALTFVSLLSYGQNVVPNGGFETWIYDTFYYPTNYAFNSNSDVHRFKLPFNIIRNTDAIHGNYSLKLNTAFNANDTFMGYLINVDPGKGDPSTWKGGMPYNQKPTGLRGFYKFSATTNDSGMIIVTFNKTGNNIGTYVTKFGGIHNTFTPFNFTFNPALTQTPDSMIIAFVSSDYTRNDMGVAGSSLTIDSISFTGVSSQPAQLNGDFESWQWQGTRDLASWNTDNSGEGVDLSLNPHSGNYAVKISTYFDERDNKNREGSIYNGNYDNNCNCMRGGLPYSSQFDTLSFWYKYAPASGDTAEIQINYSKNGSGVGGNGRYLHASPNYQYIEIPLTPFQPVDTLYLRFQSSIWRQNGPTSSGSVLILDDVRFKSQPAAPSAPLIGAITHPTCTLATGSVALSGLPSGTWTLVRNPGNVATSGSGTNTLVSGLNAGTYNFRVVNSNGDSSLISTNAVINAQPATPTAPVIGTLTQPTCTNATGSIELTGLPVGNWTLTKYPSGTIINGTGTSYVVSGINPLSNHTFTVTNASGCVSPASANAMLNAQPVTPAAPVITQTGFILHSSVASGNQWYNQLGVISGATNQDYTVTSNGNYSATVTENGCTSVKSNIINVTNVGLENQDLNGKLILYPNPVEEKLILNFKGNTVSNLIEIRNSIGELVYNGNFTDHLIIQTTDFKPGFYFVLIENENLRIYRKLLKE